MTHRRTWMIVAALVITALAACGGDPGSSAGTASTGSGGTSAVTTGSAGGATTSAGGASSTTSDASSTGTGSVPILGTCWDPAPAGVKHAAAIPAYSGGACPMFVPGDNTLTSGGNARKFKLVVPSTIDPNKPLPVVFLWHWLKGSAQSFYDKGQIADAVEGQGFIAVMPEAKGDLTFTWPFNVIDSQARMDEEFTFFDDLLACVTKQYNVNADCVSSAGVSAGALFTDQLAGVRGDHLSSIISLSGGVDANVIRPWGHPEHHMPAIVLWGGDMDNCFGVLSFANASASLETGLTSDGDFMIECIHNCGHAAPPFEAPMGLSEYAGLWQFAFDHPFWLATGVSPYLKSGLPPGLPPWCAIGKGNAVQRTGSCPDKPGC